MFNVRLDIPIYGQIEEYIIQHIISGEYVPGQQLQTVRELSQMMNVNPNTVQRALSEVERKGLLFSQRTNGRYVTEDQNLINSFKSQYAKERIEDFFNRMNNMGFNNQEILQKIKEEMNI